MTDKLKSHNFEVVIKNGGEDNEKEMNGGLGGVDEQEKRGNGLKHGRRLKNNILETAL